MQRYRLAVGSDPPDEPGIPVRMQMAAEGYCGPDRAGGFESPGFVGDQS